MLTSALQMRLAEPEKEWTVDPTFFAKQSDMDIYMKWRDGAQAKLKPV